MPYIDAKITGTVTPAQREILKTELGQAVTLLHKPESFLMIGFQDEYDLYFGGKQMEKGAYVSIAMLGEPTREDTEAMTAKVTEIFQEQLDIPPKCLYISYHGVRDWGWRGKNF